MISGYGATIDGVDSDYKFGALRKHFRLSFYADYLDLTNNLSGEVLFKGKLRNISELKRIMKQINIK